MDLEAWRREFAERSARQRAEDLAAGRARIGGRWTSLSYRDAYLEAAHVLVEQARSIGFQSLAVPVVYLQRHVLELSLKGILELMYEVSKYCADEHPELTPSQGAQRRLDTSHELEGLLRDLRSALPTLATAGFVYPPLPADLDELVREFTELEAGEASRLRYESVPDRAKKGEHVKSFPEEKVIPVEQFQRRLVGIVACIFEGSDGTPCIADAVVEDLIGLDSER